MDKSEAEILVKLEEQVKTIFNKMDKMDKKLFGNGKDGLVIQVDRHDQILKSYSKLFWVLGVSFILLIAEKVLCVFLP